MSPISEVAAQELARLNRELEQCKARLGEILADLAMVEDETRQKTEVRFIGMDVYSAIDTLARAGSKLSRLLK